MKQMEKYLTYCNHDNYNHKYRQKGLNLCPFNDTINILSPGKGFNNYKLRDICIVSIKFTIEMESEITERVDLLQILYLS